MMGDIRLLNRPIQLGPEEHLRAAELRLWAPRYELPVAVCATLIGPPEWSKRNVSLALAFALAGAWPAQLVGVAQPATRRRLARTPRVLAVGIRATHGV